MCGLVSIIVPVYNVYRYLTDCVESLKKQTYEQLEIILVDDGSTDGSEYLCNQLEKTDDRITIYHKKNGGVSSARNYGIDRAKGTFLMFVDGDDWLEPTGVELMVKRLYETKSDACYCNKYYKNTNDVKTATNISSNTIYSTYQIMNIHMRYGFIASPCLSLFWKEKVKYVRFREDIHALEDWEYNFQVLRSINSVAILNTAYYHYRTVEGSASKSPLNKRKLTCFKIVDSVRKTIVNNNSSLCKSFYNVPAFLIYHMLVIYSNNGDIDDAGNKLRVFARQYVLQILLSSDVDCKHKMYTVIACISIKLFKKLYLLKNK